MVRVRHADLRLPAWLPGLALTLLLTLPTWSLFLHPALDVARLLDGDQHLAKAYSLAQPIAAGEWYPRWTPDLYGGYGYPTFVFYAPATYYLLLAVALLPGAGLATAFQVVGAARGVRGRGLRPRLGPVAQRPGGAARGGDGELRPLRPGGQPLRQGGRAGSGRTGPAGLAALGDHPGLDGRRTGGGRRPGRHR